MMTIKKAKEILDTIEVSQRQIDASEKKMSKKIEDAISSGQYRKQGGVMFKFSDGEVAWITKTSLWGEDFHLTERGETLYIGDDKKKCAEMLCKLGLAHIQYENFLGCR